MNQHVAIRVAKADITRCLSVLALCPGLEVDEQLKLSTLEGESDLYEIVSQLLNENEEDEGTIEALKAQIEARRERKARIESRIEARKNAIASLMDCAQLTKLALPEATVSLRTLKPRPKVVDVDQLPEGFYTLIRKPDQEALERAFADGGHVPPGAALTNGSVSVSVRRK